VERKIIHTADGSHSVSIPAINVSYHSTHGAIQESKHVFIQAGLHEALKFPPTEGASMFQIFEMGFGTGLNALLTFIETQKVGKKVYYETIDLFPLRIDEAKTLNYCDILDRTDLQVIFDHMHVCDWEKEVTIESNFILKKRKTNLLDVETSPSDSQAFELIYFDAFDPSVQPDLWTEEIFKKLFSILQPGGVLVTYSSKGIVRRAMRAAGFEVEKIPGPTGKREIVRARKVK